MEYFVIGTFFSVGSYILYSAFRRKDEVEIEMYRVIAPLSPPKTFEDKQIQTDNISYSPMKVVENLSPKANYYFVPNKFPTKKFV